jgi:hypothetical protein
MASVSCRVVSSTEAMTPAPTQELLTQQWRAATTTPMAVWSGRRSPGALGASSRTAAIATGANRSLAAGEGEP